MSMERLLLNPTRVHVVAERLYEGLMSYTSRTFWMLPQGSESEERKLTQPNLECDSLEKTTETSVDRLSHRGPRLPKLNQKVNLQTNKQTNKQQ